MVRVYRSHRILRNQGLEQRRGQLLNLERRQDHGGGHLERSHDQHGTQPVYGALLEEIGEGGDIL